jgi:predicted nucleic acid-binding protein
VVIAIDTSIAIPWFEGRDFAEAEQVRTLAEAQDLIMPGVTLTELLSGRTAAPELLHELRGFPELAVLPGYWVRAGQLRQKALNQTRRARLGDALIAQACIDSNVPLLTRDKDFAVFAEVGGLALA